MSEFEKWWDKVLKMHWSHSDKGVCYCAWKAALRWALKSGYVDDYGDDRINSWDIEEEINATSEKRY